MKRIFALVLILMLSFSALAAYEAPQAVSRGGTIVVRVPWSWINGQQLVGSWWGSIDHPVGDTKEQVLFPVMPPSDVAEWVLQGSMEEELIRVFTVARAESKAMVMNRRPLDDNYYVVIRPEKKFGGSFDLHYSVSEWGMTMNDDIVHGNLKLDQETQRINLKIDSLDGIKAAWQKNFDGFGITLFEVQGVYIAVITEKNARKEDLEYTQLYIDAPGYDFDYFYLQMEGYMDGKNGVYCCVLSEAEAKLMMDDVSVRLEHDHSKW